MHKKIPKICTGCRVSAAKIYLYHSTKIAKARPHSEEWQTDTSVQKQWSMTKATEQLMSYCPNMHIGIYCESAAQSFHSLKTAAFGIKDKKSALLSPFFMTISLLKIIVAQEVHNGLKSLSECTYQPWLLRTFCFSVTSP